MPGFGRADAPRRFDYSPEGSGRFLGAALDRLGIERCHLVVHDLGGPFSWPWAAAHPQRVGSVVAINTGTLTGRRWHRMARIWRRPVIGELAMAIRLRRPIEHVRSALPGAEVVHLPESGHFPFADDPAGTAAAVIPFLRRHARPAS